MDFKARRKEGDPENAYDEARGLSTFGASLNGLRTLDTSSTTGDSEQLQLDDAKDAALMVEDTPIIEELPRVPNGA